MHFIQTAQRAIGEEHLDGWLFFNFHGRDTLANRLLGLEESSFNTRPWYCLIPSRGEPVKIVHAIERKILDSLPGRTAVYSSRQQLSELLTPLAGSWAAQISEDLTVISTLDYGTARYLESLGFSLKSSASLIQKTAGVLDDEAIASHQRAAELLYDCIRLTWEEIRRSFTRNIPLTESQVQGWIHDFFREHHLVTNHPILVASGVNTSDPHYAVPPEGAPLRSGDLVQFDIWAKEDAPGSIYADISQAGVLADKPPEEAEAVFGVITEARDRAIALVAAGLEAGRPVTGAEVDQATRAVLINAGYGTSIAHRTGHGIDTEVHGCGVNLDSVEFPDHRTIIEGSCFSVEPGLYLERFGLRTEINAYRWNDKVIVSGGPVQTVLFTL